MGQNIAANNAVIRFQNINDIDIVVDVPQGFVANDIRSAAIQHSVAELSTAPRRQFPVRLKEAAQIADPHTQIFPVRFALKAPPNITALPGYDGHRYNHLPERPGRHMLLSRPLRGRKPANRWRGFLGRMIWSIAGL